MYLEWQSTTDKYRVVSLIREQFTSFSPLTLSNHDGLQCLPHFFMYDSFHTRVSVLFSCVILLLLGATYILSISPFMVPNILTSEIITMPRKSKSFELRYAHRSARLISASNIGLSGANTAEATWANKKYHGHLHIASRHACRGSTSPNWHACASVAMYFLSFPPLSLFFFFLQVLIWPLLAPRQWLP